MMVRRDGAGVRLLTRNGQARLRGHRLLGRDLGKPLVASLRPAILDHDGASIDPAKFAQPLHEEG